MTQTTFALLFGVAASLAAGGSAAVDEPLRSDAASLFGRIDAASPEARAAPEVELGRALFWDTRLSSDGKTACASCHAAQDWGADRRRFSIDARHLPTSRQSPTVFNSMSQPALRWLGDRKSGAEQAEGSLTGSMGFASKQVGVELLSKLNYEPAFRKAYPAQAAPLNAENYGRALQAYQASLTTPAAFDRFLGGDGGALTSEQKKGLRTFMTVGCAACHNGPLFGGTMFRRFGITKDYWLETKSEKIDVGRYAMTKNEEDRYVFRVPMLRNVAKTAPYFHDGSVDRLDRAVRIMASVQLGRTVNDTEVTEVVAFLTSLTGEIPPHYAPPGERPEAR